ncbi:flightin isoform X2 [Hyalella azteca]|uniref:Flightin isoform X2 n=1 Tax=Hyalella azteca TaxID=294128 RepID=A0A8B7NIA1_HYAAZ|nr:flightin isoform X2 [Hyalella azteca]
MAGDEEKKKKKKPKKGAAEEAPPPEPAPAEPEPAPAPAPAPVEGDTDDWLSAATAEEPAPASDEAAPAPAEGEAPPEGEEAPLGQEGELPPQPKPKPKFFVHWDRRKAKFYDYNFDYGTNYYSSMVGYVDQKNTGSATVPRRMAFAERGMYSSLERSRNPDLKTQTLLNDVRSSIRNFENSQRIYAYGSNRKRY